MKLIKLFLAFFSKKKNVIIIEEKGNPKFKKLILDIRDGQEVFTVPWAYDPKSKVLDLNLSFTESPQGTFSMPVKRQGSKFIVNTEFNYFGEPYLFDV